MALDEMVLDEVSRIPRDEAHFLLHYDVCVCVCVLGDGGLIQDFSLCMLTQGVFFSVCHLLLYPVKSREYEILILGVSS